MLLIKGAVPGANKTLVKVFLSHKKQRINEKIFSDKIAAEQAAKAEQEAQKEQQEQQAQSEEKSANGQGES